MATTNENRIMQPVGERPLFSIVKATAVAADDTAGNFTVTVDVPTGASIKAWVVDYRDSTGTPVLVDVSLSGNTFTVADQGTALIQANDVAQIWVAYDYR